MPILERNVPKRLNMSWKPCWMRFSKESRFPTPPRVPSAATSLMRDEERSNAKDKACQTSRQPKSLKKRQVWLLSLAIVGNAAAVLMGVALRFGGDSAAR